MVGRPAEPTAAPIGRLAASASVAGAEAVAPAVLAPVGVVVAGVVEVPVVEAPVVSVPVVPVPGAVDPLTELLLAALDAVSPLSALSCRASNDTWFRREIVLSWTSSDAVSACAGAALPIAT